MVAVTPAGPPGPGAPRTSATIPDLDKGDELPSLTDLLAPGFAQPSSAKIHDGEPRQKAHRRESGEQLSDFVFDVFAEDDSDGPSRKDGRSGESPTHELPTPDRREFPLSLSESPGTPVRMEAVSGRETGPWDASGGRVRQVTVLRQTATGSGCQVLISIGRWLSRPAVETTLVRKFWKRQRAEKAVRARCSLRLRKPA
jgi:hypothetical protein